MSRRSALSWSDYFDEKVDIPIEHNSFCVYKAGSTGPFIVLLHGGGHSSLTWSLTAKILKPHCRVIAIDFRGHGDTKCTDETDLSAATLIQDILQILTRVLPAEHELVLIGHSMGGAIAVRVACESVFHIKGLMVIDVVEGTALAALTHMTTFLKNRPKGFTSVEAAIDWSLSSNTIKNVESARVSIPSQIVSNAEGEFVWRTDLLQSEQYWRGWFSGLSEMFLTFQPHKVLLLAGTDRLDTALTRGQMQGKFQLVLMYGCGHVIQEDNPDETAKAILTFCSRILTMSGMENTAQLDLQSKLDRARALIPT